MSHFNKIIKSYKETINITGAKAWDIISSMEELFDELEETRKDTFWDIMKDIHEEIKGKHFDECYAIYEVSHMYSMGVKGGMVKGEVVSFKEAEKVYEEHKRHFKQPANVWDVYVALNAQHHDYYAMFYEWANGDESKIKDKIIQSTITFWFRDEDAEEGKVWNYFDKD